MTEILKEWLTERLNETFNWEEANFGEMMRDGDVIARLLLNYKIICDEDYFLVQPTADRNEIASNWKHLSAWLKVLDIEIESSELNDIINGNAPTLLKLFYQLFLNLDKKVRMDFIKKERMLVSDLVTKLGSRFNVEKVDEVEVPVIDYLAKPLLDEKYFIEWQKKKSENLKLTYDLIRHKYKKKIERLEEGRMQVKREPAKSFKFSQEKRDIEKFEKKHPCKYNQYTYNELIEMEIRGEGESTSNIFDEEWAKEYMENLQSTYSNKIKSRKFQHQVSSALSTTIWEEILQEEEEHFDKDLAEKVMKLSHFEKQMATQLIETKQQARNVINNRKSAEKEYAAQKEREFGQFLDDLSNDIHNNVLQIDFEKQRQEELHKILYEEKIKRKREHHYEICYEIMLALVHYVCKYAQMKAMTELDEVPSYYVNQWKSLFFNQQPLFDIVDSVEQILELDELGEGDKVESIIHLEIDRQNIQNDSDFTEYKESIGLWNLEYLISCYDPNSKERKEEYRGIRVVGQVVHTLLDIKYPPVPPKKPAELPEYISKAILRGLPNNAITVAMQILLNKAKIHVVRLEVAINYCLAMYKMEMTGCEDITFPFDVFMAESRESQVELVKLLKSEDEASRNTSVVPLLLDFINSKQTQTPKTIPEEDLELSPAATLGKYAFELLCSGDSLTEHLLAAIIVEYLKSIEDLSGFVIINYPNTYYETQILEDTILGRSPPNIDFVENEDDMYLEKINMRENPDTVDPYGDLRISKLLPDPRPKREETPFVTYFTSYINLIYTKNISEEYYIWDKLRDDEIDRFYMSQYVDYSMYYEEINKDVLVMMCRLIIGDFTMPIKDNDTLFGSVLANLDFPASVDKRTKSKVVKTSRSASQTKGKAKKVTKGSSGKMSSSDNTDDITEILKSVDVSVSEALEESCMVSTEDVMLEEDEEVLPGDENWEYSELQLTENYGIALASMWEAEESAYISSMDMIFFGIRLQMNVLIPYICFLRDKVRQLIEAPSEKTEIVLNFQQRYNEFADDWRDRTASKVEWHCRVQELQLRLSELCDERKREAMAERQRLIDDNWTLDEVTVMANTYISAMQAELNRCILTFQLLHDYYLSLLKKPLSADRLTPKELVKLSRETDETPRSRRSGVDDKLFAKIKSALQDMHAHNVPVDQSNNPYIPVLDSNLNLATKIITDLHARYELIVSKIQAETLKAPAAVSKQKNVLVSQVLDDSLRENFIKCVEEWKAAVDGEMQRVCLREQMLFNKAILDLELFNSLISKTFVEIAEEIDENYTREIQAVERLCELLRLMVEKGERMEDSLVLDLDDFYVDPNVKMFSLPEPPPPSPITYKTFYDEFNITHLDPLLGLLRLIAPTGVILTHNVIYALQDFLLLSKESYINYLPSAWSRLEPEQIPDLVQRLFGNSAYVDWRDLLLYFLDIPYPHVGTLLDLSLQLTQADVMLSEVVPREGFMQLPLWFEDDRDEEEIDHEQNLRARLIKELLFKMFEVENDMCNYSALLLSICKAEDSRRGFGAAVSIAIGKEICWCWEECGPSITRLIEDKQYQDACHECACDCALKLGDQLIENVIQKCEGVVITEITRNPSELEMERRHKLKGTKSKSSPTKPPPVSVSARLAASPPTHMASPPPPPSLILSEAFEEHEVGEEEASVRPASLPEPGYCVRPEVVWRVLRSALPWQWECGSLERQAGYVGAIRDLLTTLSADTDTGEVYLAKFLIQPQVLALLENTNRFQARSLLQIATDMQKTASGIVIH